MDLVGHGSGQDRQDVAGTSARGRPVQLGYGGSGGPLEGDEEVEPAFPGVHLGTIAQEVAEWVMLDVCAAALPPSVSGKRAMPWR